MSAGITEMVLNLGKLDNTNYPSNTLLTYHVIAYDDSTHYGPYATQYKKLKTGGIISLALRITRMKNNIMTDGPVTTVG